MEAGAGTSLIQERLENGEDSHIDILLQTLLAHQKQS